MRVALYIDDANLSANSGGHPINWRAFVKFAQKFGELTHARLYDSISPEFDGTPPHTNFVNAIRRMGITYTRVPYRSYTNGEEHIVKGNVDGHLIADCMRASASFDVLVLASADADYLRMVEHLRADGKYVIATSFSRPAIDLRIAVDLYLSAYLFPGCLRDDDGSTVRGVCYNTLPESGLGYLRYIKPDWSGDIMETDNRVTGAAWESAKFNIPAGLISALPNTDIVLEFSLINGAARGVRTV